MDSQTGKPSPWRWVVMAASFAALFFTACCQYHVGVMQVAILRRYQSDVIATTWMMSYYLSLFALCGPVASVVINMANCRACVVLSGILNLAGFSLSAVMAQPYSLFFTLTLSGLGQSLAYTGSVVILAYYFPSQSSLVTGVCLAGGGLSMFVHPPLFAWLEDLYGLQGAMLLTGAVAFHGTLAGFLMRPSRYERRRRQTYRGALLGLCSNWPKRLSVLCGSSFLCVLLSVLVMSLAFHALLVLLPALLIKYSELSTIEASLAVSLAGVGSLVSRVLSGVTAHDDRVGALLVYCGLLGVEAVVALLAPSLLTSGLAGAYVYSLLVGLYSGGSIALMNTVVLSVVGIELSATGFGLAMCMLGAGGLTGAPALEAIYESSHSAYVLFGSISLLFGLAAMFGFLAEYFKPRLKSSQEPEEDVESKDDRISQDIHANRAERGSLLVQSNTDVATESTDEHTCEIVAFSDERTEGEAACEGKDDRVSEDIHENTAEKESLLVQNKTDVVT